MFRRLLIANRGEIAIRVMRTAANLGISTVAVYSQDDKDSLHVYRADEALELPGEGAAAYLSIENLIDAARAAGCDAIHPGYGFLSENAQFATACEVAKIAFVGPTPATLARLGDKGAARQLAIDAGVPVLKGTMRATSLAEAGAFLDALDAGEQMIIKAIAGGGGRGVRIVESKSNLADAFERSAHEAKSAFGDDALYVEQFMPRARHIEVQILADAAGNAMHLGERDCSLQRRHQKIIEIAPAPALDSPLRTQLHERRWCWPRLQTIAAPARSSFWLTQRTRLSRSSKPTPVCRWSWHDQDIQPAVRTGRSTRYVRVPGLSHQPQVRFPSCKADYSHAQQSLCRHRCRRVSSAV